MTVILNKRDWEISERLVTPEALVMGRRAALGAAGAALLLPGGARAQGAPMDPAFANAGRPITPEADATSYNNFYEFGTDKSIARAAQRLPITPWSVKIDGMVAKPMTIGLEDLLKRVKLEQRVYRHRCVEAWAMTVPWTGFQLSDLIRIAAPDFRRQIRRDDDAGGPEGDARPTTFDHRLALSRGPAHG